MKKAIIGGFLSLIGTIGILAVFLTAANNMVDGWSNPPGRFLTTVSEIGMNPLLFGSCIMLFFGLVIMALEYFRKDTW